VTRARLDATAKRLLAAGDRLVLADHLQKLGDPWGELIALQHQGLDASALIPQVVGPLHPASVLSWDRGFVRTAMLGCTPSELARAAHRFLRKPVASLATDVSLMPMPARLPTTRGWDSAQSLVDLWPAVLAPLFPAQLTGVGLGGSAPAAAFVLLPSYDALSALRHVRRLSLAGHPRPSPGVLRLPELVELDVRFAHATDADVAALAAWELPRLERLAVSIGGDARCVLDDVYKPRPTRPRYPKTYTPADLARLEVHEVDAPEGSIVELCESLPPSVAHVTIRGASPTAEAALRAHPALAGKTVDIVASDFFYRYVATVE
jgi:hypothetical protein